MRVLIVADDVAMRRGLAIRLDAEPDLAVVGAVPLAAPAGDAPDPPSVVVLGARRIDAAVHALAAALRDRPVPPAVVLLSLDGRAGTIDGLPAVSMHDGDAALLRAIRTAAATRGDLPTGPRSQRP